MIWRCINVSEVVLVIVSRYVAIGIFCILIDTFIYLTIAVLTLLVHRYACEYVDLLNIKPGVFGSYGYMRHHDMEMYKCK